MRFPCFAASFECASSTREAADIISKTVEYKYNNLEIVGATVACDGKTVLRTKPSSYVGINSFSPVINIKMREEGNAVSISLVFELRRAIRVFMAILALLALSIEAVLLAHLIGGQLAEIALLILPLGMLLFSFAICIAGLYFSSKKVLEILFLDLNGGDYVKLPALHFARRNDIA